MKKMITINLNNTVFHIDDDTYEVLKKYLAEISFHFISDKDKDYIMADIEARIAELFLERLRDNNQAITLADVNDIIIIMGKPDEFSNDDNNELKGDVKSEGKPRKAYQFYRDPENAFLDGQKILEELESSFEEINHAIKKI